MKRWQVAALVAFHVVLFVVVMGYEVMAWKECRATGHSWLFCSRLLSR